MNMPDPQAFAATWMTQLTDPSAWQGWLKMPAADLGAGAVAPLAGNPLAGILKDFKVGVAPARLDALRQDYLQKAGKLWQDFMLGRTPALHDRRFSGSDWTSNPFSAFSAASYLLNADFMMALADAVEAPARERQKIRFAVQQMWTSQRVQVQNQVGGLLPCCQHAAASKAHAREHEARGQ